MDDLSDDDPAHLSEATVKIPPSLIREARALHRLYDSDDEQKEDSRHLGLPMGVSRAALDNAARLLEGGESVTLNEEQWRSVADVACWLDNETLETAVITHYRNLFDQDPAVVSRMHTRISDIDKRVDIPLAKRILGNTIRETADMYTAAQQENAWKVTILGGQSGSVDALAVLHNGRLVSGSACASTRLWNVANGECTDEFEFVSGYALAVLPDGRLAFGALDSIKLWDTVTNTCSATITCREHGGSYIFCLLVLPDGRLASGGATICLWNTVTGACTATLIGHSEAVLAMVVLPDGRLASGSEDESIKLWNTATNTCTATLTGHLDWVAALTVLPDGRLASGSSDHSIKLWDTATNECTATLTDHSDWVMALAVIPDGRLASGSVDSSIKLWNTATNTCTATLTGHTKDVCSLTVLPDGRLASGSIDTSIKLWNTDTCICTATLEGPSWQTQSVAVLHDGRIAVAYEDKSVRVWSPVTRVCDALLGVQTSEVLALAGLPDGRLASGSDDFLVRLWDVAAGTCTELSGHTNEVSALAVLPDNVLASGSLDRTVWLWDTVRCTALRTLDSPHIVLNLAVLSDGHLAAPGAVWRTDTYERVSRPKIASGNMFGYPSASDTIFTWTQRLRDVATHNRSSTYHNSITAFATLPNGQIVHVIDHSSVHLNAVILTVMPHVEKIIVSGDGSVVVAGNGVRVLKPVPSRANVFLALTAIDLPPPYILKVMS